MQDNPNNVLQIYKARIVKKMPVGDDRLQVRIIPHMMNIPESKLLPKYPPFFQGQVITGVSEVDVDDEVVEEGVRPEFVWVAALPDFTVGYVLGRANPWPGEDSFPDSLNFEDIVSEAQKLGVVPKDMKYKDMHVQYWNDNYLEMVNTRYGDKYIFTSSGTMMAMVRNQMFIQVGNRNPDDPGSPFSVFRVARDFISMQTDLFRIKAKNIVMGEKQLSLVATSTAIPFSVQGATLHPLSNIKA